MEKIGSDLIFYILVAVIAIISAIGRKKPAKRKPAPVRNNVPADEEAGTVDVMDWMYRDQVNPDSDMEIEVDESYGSGKAAEAVEANTLFDGIQPDSKTEKLVAQFADEGEREIINPFENEGESVTDSEIHNDESGISHFVDKETSLASSIAEEFDLPKAIVFAEILKRKEEF